MSAVFTPVCIMHLGTVTHMSRPVTTLATPWPTASTSLAVPPRPTISPSLCWAYHCGLASSTSQGSTYSGMPTKLARWSGQEAGTWRTSMSTVQEMMMPGPSWAARLSTDRTYYMFLKAR